MTKRAFLCAVAIIAWLSYGNTLWPLPSVQVERDVKIIQATLDDLMKSTPQPDNAEAAMHKRVKDRAREFIAGAAIYEYRLWVSWLGRLALIVLGVTGWLLYLKKHSPGIALIVASAVLFTAAQLIFDLVVYTELFSSWLQGETGFSLLPWSFVCGTLYFYYAMPLFLLISAYLVLRWKHEQSAI